MALVVTLLACIAVCAPVLALTYPLLGPATFVVLALATASAVAVHFIVTSGINHVVATWLGALLGALVSFSHAPPYGLPHGAVLGSVLSGCVSVVLSSVRNWIHGAARSNEPQRRQLIGAMATIVCLVIGSVGLPVVGVLLAYYCGVIHRLDVAGTAVRIAAVCSVASVIVSTFWIVGRLQRSQK